MDDARAAEDIETLADSIAHDEVSPPEDDDSPDEVSRILWRVHLARAAAYAALTRGESTDAARQAARAAVAAHTPAARKE